MPKCFRRAVANNGLCFAGEQKRCYLLPCRLAVRFLDGRCERKGSETEVADPGEHAHRRGTDIERAKVALHEPPTPLIRQAIAQKAGQLIESVLALAEDDR